MEKERSKKSSSYKKSKTSSGDKKKLLDNKKGTGNIKEKPEEKQGLLEQQEGELEGAVGGEVEKSGDFETIAEIDTPQTNAHAYNLVEREITDVSVDHKNEITEKNVETMVGHDEIVISHDYTTQPTDENTREQPLIDLSDSTKASSSKPKQSREDTAKAQQSDVEDLKAPTESVKQKTVSPTKQQEYNVIDFMTENKKRLLKYHPGEKLVNKLDLIKDNIFYKKAVTGNAVVVNNLIADILNAFVKFDNPLGGDESSIRIYKNHMSDQIKDLLSTLNGHINKLVSVQTKSKTAADKREEKKRGLLTAALSKGFGFADGNAMVPKEVHDKKQSGPAEYKRFKEPSNTKTSHSPGGVSSKAASQSKGKTMKR